MTGDASSWPGTPVCAIQASFRSPTESGVRRSIGLCRQLA